MTWARYNPKKKGKVLWDDCQSKISEERREMLRQKMKKMHAEKKANK